MFKLRSYIFFILLFLIAGCMEEDRQPGNKEIFFDYQVRGQEDEENITCTFQYKTGDAGEKGTLQDRGSVIFDGDTLEADSAVITGVYYETIRPLEGFRGKHSIVYTDKAGRQYREEFEFIPFTLSTPLPETIRNRPFEISLDGLDKDTVPLRLVMINFGGNGEFHDMVNVINGKLSITGAILQKLGPGPVVMQLFREEDKPVKNATPAGGRLQISYGLSREFEIEMEN